MNNNAIEHAWQGPSQCEECGIRHLVLFSALEKDEFALIHDPIDEISFHKGKRLYREGEAPRHVFTVREGAVKLVHYLSDGSERIVRLLVPGDVAGLEALLGQAYQHDAVVIDAALTCRIPVRAVNQLARDLPHFHRQLMMRWQDAVNAADNWLTELGTGSARARVARLLLHFARTSPDRACFMPTREDMGAMLGVSTETVSRITADFKRAGLLEYIAPHRARIRTDAMGELAEGS